MLLHLAREGVLAGAGAVPAAARGHRAQLPRGASTSGTGWWRGSGCGWRWRTSRTGSTTAGCASGPTAPATRCRPCRCWTRSTSTGSTRCSAAAAATRSGPGPRSGSSACATRSASGTRARQRPELWNLYNGRHRPGEHVRVFPLSNWTELDVWRYIEREDIELPSIYYAHEREVFQRDGMWLAEGPWGGPRGARDRCERRTVRYRTVGDGSCTGAVESDGGHASTRSSPRSTASPAHRARRHPRRRPAVRGGHGGPEARGLLLMSTRSARGFATAGSVDDGKSTLVGRLLYDTKSVLADQIEAVHRASVDKGLSTPDLSLLVDGLRAEREQGITIDVAYRYFATPTPRVRAGRHPGARAVHPQHGDRRVHRGAGRAAGRRPQRRRRADPPARRGARAAAGAAAGAGGQQDRPGRLRRGACSTAIAQGLRRPTPLARASPTTRWSRSRCPRCVGDNVVERSARTPWYDGPDAARAPGVGAGRPDPDAARRSGSRCST